MRPRLLLVALLAVSAPLPLAAQVVRHAQPTGTAAEAQQALPIRRVALYKNGVGFFEHTGTVHGDSAVRIDFTTAQLNDVLQSLTAVDLGGGRIVPKVGILGAVVQLSKALQGGIPVKDASSAAPPTA